MERKLDTLLFLIRDAASDNAFGRLSTDLHGQSTVVLLSDEMDALDGWPAHIQLILGV